MSENPYDEMTHDEILKEHSKLYLQLTPQQRTQLAAERENALKEANSARNKKLADLTLGEIIDELSRTGGKLLNKLALYVVLFLIISWFFRYIGWWR